MKKRKITFGNIIIFILSTITVIIMAFPIYWMIASSLMTQDELLSNVPKLIPSSFQYVNYINVFKRTNMWSYTLNTVIITAGTLLLQLGVGIFAAYGFAFDRPHSRLSLPGVYRPSGC